MKNAAGAGSLCFHPLLCDFFEIFSTRLFISQGRAQTWSCFRRAAMTPPETGPAASSNGGRPKRSAATKAVAKVRQALFDPPNGSSSSSSRVGNLAGQAKTKSSLAYHEEAPAASAASTTAAAMVAATAAVASGELSAACPEAKATCVPQRTKKAASEREGYARPAASRPAGSSNPRNALAKKDKGKRGQQGKPSAGDARLKSGGRGRGRVGNGRADPRVRLKPGTNAAAMARVLERLATYGVKVRVPANPSMPDIWAAVEAVQANLPETYKLTVDHLVGLARVRHIKTNKKGPSASGFGCGRRFPRPSDGLATAAVSTLSDFVFLHTSFFLQ